MIFYLSAALPCQVQSYKLLLQLYWVLAFQCYGAGALAPHSFWLKPVMCEYSCIIKALGDRGLLDSVNGKIAVGWLLVEDLVMVLVLVLLPATAVLLGGKAPAGAEGNIWLTLGITLLKVIGFIAFMLIVGKRVVPIIMQFVARLGSRELLHLL